MVGSQGTGSSPGLTGALGSPADPSGALGSPLSHLRGPGGASPSSGGFGSTGSPDQGSDGSGIGRGAPFVPPRPSAGASFGNGPETSMGSQPGLGSSLTGPVGGGFGTGSGGSPLAGIPSSIGSSGVSGGGSPGAIGSGGIGAPGAGPRRRGPLPPGSGGHRHRRPLGKPSPAAAAAIGLGVVAGALAASAISAGIASAFTKPRSGLLGGARRVCPGCPQAPCVIGCGRKRRSIPESKVPPEILNSIPTNFERLY